jgi:hypothetical protein
MDVTPLLERQADAADSPIHHVGWRDDIHAGLGLRERLLLEDFERDVVDDVAAAVDDAVLAVGGIRIQCDVGHDAEIGEAFFQRPHCARDQPFRVERLASVAGFQLLLDHREKRHHRHAQFHAALGNRQEAVDRHALDPRHRIHFLGAVFTVLNEHREDEVACIEHRLAHQPAREFVATHATHADRGEGAVNLHGADF